MGKHNRQDNPQAIPEAVHHVSTLHRNDRYINVLEVPLASRKIVHKVTLACDDRGEIRLEIHALPQYGTHALHKMFFGDVVDVTMYCIPSIVALLHTVFTNMNINYDVAKALLSITVKEETIFVTKADIALKDVHPYVYYCLASTPLLLRKEIGPDKLKFRWNLSSIENNAKQVADEIIGHLRTLQDNGLIESDHYHIILEHFLNYITYLQLPFHFYNNAIDRAEDNAISHAVESWPKGVPVDYELAAGRAELGDAVRKYDIERVRKVLSRNKYIKSTQAYPFDRTFTIPMVCALFTVKPGLYKKAMEIISWLVYYGVDAKLLESKLSIDDYIKMFMVTEITEKIQRQIENLQFMGTAAVLHKLITDTKTGDINLDYIEKNLFFQKKRKFFLDAARILSAMPGIYDEILPIVPAILRMSELSKYVSFKNKKKSNKIEYKTVNDIAANLSNERSKQSLDITFFDGKRVTLESHWSKDLNATEKKELFEIYDRHFELLKERAKKTLPAIFYDEVVPDDEDIRLDIIRDEQGKVLAFVANQTFKTTINGKKAIVSFNVLSLSSSELKPYQLMHILSMIRGWHIAKHCGNKYDVYSYGDVVSMHGAYAMLSSENSFPKYAENADTALKIMKMIAPNVEFFCETINGVNIIYRKDIPVVLKESYNKQYLCQQSLVTMRQLTGEFFDSLVEPGSSLVTCFQYTESYMQEFKEMILGIMSEYHMNILDAFYMQNSILADSNTTNPCRDSQLEAAYNERPYDNKQASEQRARL